MKNLYKILLIVVIFAMTLFLFSCSKKDDTNVNKPDDKIITEDASVTVDEDGEKTEQESLNLTQEEKAINILNSYVNAAKKLDFDAMGKYISDNNSLPILESYRQAYSRYAIDDQRIQELCKARLSTYKITPVSAVKNGSDMIVKANISMVNMESLENKWMETLCNKYPEYTTLTSDEMTPEVVDVLIQTMIDVLNEADSTVEVQKDFMLKANGDSWIINAKNEDIFPSN